jgi:hypothetical protein
MTFKGAEFHSNSLGMRDREYLVERSPETIRIAILGSSHVMGSGVDDDQTFENVLEDKLNQAHSASVKYEVLNFAVPGYGLLQATVVAEQVLPRFRPDVVVYFVHPGEARRAIERILWAMELGGQIGPGYEYIDELLAESDARSSLPAAEFVHRLLPHRNQILEWAFDRQVQAVRRLGAKPVFAFLPGVGRDFDGEELAQLKHVAEAAGARTISLAGVYSDRNPRELRLAEWDDHPNAVAHSLIAESLYRILAASGEMGALGSSPGRPAVSTKGS